MLVHFLDAAGITDFDALLNSLGCGACRPGYKSALAEFFRGLDLAALCEDCRRRLHTNPLRLLDCKVPGCRALTENAPLLDDFACAECAGHFSTVRRLLDAAGVCYILSPRLVRGLDYYVRTTFEVVSGNIGSQSAVAGGGRYDGLVAQLGGPDVPGIGFACGMERLALLLPEREATAPDFYVAVLDEAALDTGFLLAQQLRRAGFSGETAYAARSAKSHLRQAAKNHAAWACILGSNELAQNSVLLKNMVSGEQRSLPLAPLADLERAMQKGSYEH
jgi:histidyl-tRNA synthetase